MPASETLAHGALPPTRAIREEDYRGFRIAVAASRRVTGAVLVTTTLTGGPDRLQRFFCLHSPETEVNAACAAAMAEVRRVIDDLLSGA